MLEASQASDIVGLLAQTRAALAHLRADELEALAVRAEVLIPDSSEWPPYTQSIDYENRKLGDLLAATGENLRVLRRGHNHAEGNSRWAR